MRALRCRMPQPEENLMSEWIATDPVGLSRQSLERAAKTALAATFAVLASRLFNLPEGWWAAVTTMVVMQSTLGASVSVSLLRLIGTALGAAAGGLLGFYFGANAYVFGAGVLFLGILISAMQFDRSAFRFAGIALAIVMLVVRTQSAWIVALHRFLEVSLGIVVGLVVTMIWPERPFAAAPTTEPPAPLKS